MDSVLKHSDSVAPRVEFPCYVIRAQDHYGVWHEDNQTYAGLNSAKEALSHPIIEHMFIPNMGTYGTGSNPCSVDSTTLRHSKHHQQADAGWYHHTRHGIRLQEIKRRPHAVVVRAVVPSCRRARLLRTKHGAMAVPPAIGR